MNKDSSVNSFSSLEKNFKDISQLLSSQAPNTQPYNSKINNLTPENKITNSIKEIHNLKVGFHDHITSFNKTLDEICQTQIDILKNLHENN